MANHSNLPQTFQFGNLPVRTVDRDGAIWFVAADVCEALEINNPRDAINRLDDDERNTVGITDGNRGNPNVNIINESGLYSLILTSRKPQAKRFKKWVTSEVLPAIRQTGAYATPAVQAQPALESKKQKLLAHPNYELAGQLAAKAAAAVFEAALVYGEGWLKNQRLVLSMQDSAKRPNIKPVPADAYIASMEKFTQMVREGVFISMSDLANLAAACNARLVQSMN